MPLPCKFSVLFECFFLKLLKNSTRDIHLTQENIFLVKIIEKMVWINLADEVLTKLIS